MLANKSVLIVDDNKQILKVLQMYLTNMGCFSTIVTAVDGSIALNKMANQKFDLMMFDMEIPKVSGLELIQEIAKDKRAINNFKNIIVVSGTLDKDKIQKVINLGVKNFLLKPFDEQALQEKVLKVLTS